MCLGHANAIQLIPFIRGKAKTNYPGGIFMLHFRQAYLLLALVSLCLFSYPQSTFAQSYCSARGNGKNAWIRKVQINRTSIGGWVKSYKNFDRIQDLTNRVYKVTAGRGANFTLRAGYRNGLKRLAWSIKIDFNQDGVFGPLEGTYRRVTGPRLV